jgi:multiple sugar transport system permease protein
MLIPLAWMIVTSLKTFPEAMADPPIWIPEKPQWRKLPALRWPTFHFLRYLRNSALVTSLNVIGTLFSCTMAAYAFACLNFKVQERGVRSADGRHDAAGAGHHHSVFHVLCEDRLGEHLPAAPGAALAGRQRVRHLPVAPVLSDHPARLHRSCPHGRRVEWTILWRVYVPLSTPVLMTVTVFSFLASWNDLWGPL